MQRNSAEFRAAWPIVFEARPIGKFYRRVSDERCVSGEDERAVSAQKGKPRGRTMPNRAAATQCDWRRLKGIYFVDAHSGCSEFGPVWHS